jgi:predicted PurR-regulated permease PerM
MRETLATIWSNPYVRVATFIVVVAALVWLFILTQPAGTLLLGSLALAYIINPAVVFLQRYGVRRVFTVALFGIALLVGLGYVSQYTVRTIGAIVIEGDDGLALAEDVPDFFLTFPERIEGLLPERARGPASQPLDALEQFVENLDERVAPFLENFAVGAYEFVRGTVAQVFNAAMLVILTLYILLDMERISTSLRSVVPRPYRRPVRSLVETLDRVTGAYVRGQALIAVLVGLMVFVGLSLIGLPGAGVIALLAGVLNIVPFIGTIAPIIPAVVIAISGGWLDVLLVLVVFFVSNQIDAHVLTPLVLSKSTELHPVTVIVAVLAGFSLGGIWVAILAVPAVAFAKALFAEYYAQSDFYKEG